MDTIRANEPEIQHHELRALGGSAAVSIDTDGGGNGMTLTRAGAGDYLITWSENPGTFQGWSCNLGATTPGDLAGHTVIRGVYDPTAWTLQFVVYNASFAAHDLAALEYADICVKFRDY